MRSIFLAMTAAIAFLSAAPAQQLLAYDPFVMLVNEAQPSTAMLPGPGFPTNTYPAIPMPPPGAMIPFPGDGTWDGRVGLHWISNGNMLASMNTPQFPSLVPPTPPFPIAPAALGPIGGMVTGIAIDATANIMYLCGPFPVVVGVTPVPGTPIVVPPFPLMFPGAIAPLTGLEYEAFTGTFYALDMQGVVYPFFLGGAPAGAPIPTPAPGFGPPGDVAIDKSGQANAAGLRPIYVVAGPMVLDIMLPAPMPFPIGPGQNSGLAYLGAPATNPPGFGPACTCPSFPTIGPIQTTAGPMTKGNGAWGINVGGVPPGQPVLFAFDFAFNPAWPMINGLGCPFGFVFGSPTLISTLVFAGPGGNATFPLPLFVPTHLGPIYNQNFTFCTADPAGFILTPMQSIWGSSL